MLLGCLPWSGLGTFYCGVGLRFGAWGQNNVSGAWVCFLALFRFWGSMVSMGAVWGVGLLGELFGYGWGRGCSLPCVGVLWGLRYDWGITWCLP